MKIEKPKASLQSQQTEPSQASSPQKPPSLPPASYLLRTAHSQAHSSKAHLSQGHFHFVGVGGIGMCGLAHLFHTLGAKVSGSDQQENPQTQFLKDKGVTIYKGHSREHVQGADVVVYSSAIQKDNVEIVEAKVHKLPIISRAEALAELMRLRRGIAIGGTHGKTTTTSLTASIFLTAQQNPTVVIGGRLEQIQSTACLGSGEWMIAEADESDGSFHHLSPEIVVITNIDNDHLDFYKNFFELEKAFYKFAESIPFYGTLIFCGDDERAFHLFRDFGKRALSYGFSERNYFRLKKSEAQYELWEGDRLAVSWSMPLPGEHNALNAAAAILSASAAGLSLEECVMGIENFKGVNRRFQFKGQLKKCDVYDDYGHHPTEIKAVLKAFKEAFPDKKRWVVFQPHRFSRTQVCWDQFLDSFHDCDQLFLLDIYPAGEPPIEGVTSQELSSAILQHGIASGENSSTAISYFPEREKLIQNLALSIDEEKVLLSLGAGDVYKLYDESIKVAESQ